MTNSIYVGISEQPLSIQKAADFVSAAPNGALNMFVGTVRNHNLGKAVSGVCYDVFTPLACQVFQEICAQAQAQFGDHVRLYVEHFKGMLEIGGTSILIAVGSPHRDESFQACRLVIEQIKVRAPVWKQEHYLDGNRDWVKGHTLCERAQHD